MGLLSSGGFDTEQGSAFASTTGNICYSMEVKDAVLPPWVVSGLCAAMSLDATSFDLTYAQGYCISPIRHRLLNSSFVLSFLRWFSQDRYGAFVDGLERGPQLHGHHHECPA